MLIGESKEYLERRKNPKNKLSLSEGDLVFVDYPNKPGSFEFGRVKGIQGSEATVIFRNHEIKDIPVALLYALSPGEHAMTNKD